MATLAILGQSSPTLNTETYLYSGTTNWVASSLVVCNRSNSAIAQFRVSISKNGVATTNQDYIYYDLYLATNDTFIATVGICGGANDTVRVYSSTSNLSFSLYGQYN